MRNALRRWRPDYSIPSGSAVFARYLAFTEAIPALAAEPRLDPGEITYGDLVTLISSWLEMRAS